MVSKIEEQFVKERSQFYHLSLVIGRYLGIKDTKDATIDLAKFMTYNQNFAKRLLSSSWPPKINLRIRM